MNFEYQYKTLTSLIVLILIIVITIVIIGGIIYFREKYKNTVSYSSMKDKIFN